jgi:hypothetical protein
LDWDAGARSYFDNEGAFVKTASTEPSELRGISLTNAATVDLRGGSLRITEGAEYIQTGGQTTLGGGTLGEEGGVEIWGGTLLGPGTVEGDLILRNVGTLSPGGHSLGSLSVTDSYQQAPDGTLILRFEAADHDRLDVVGEATLDGNLEVGLEDGFLPEVGKRLTVMTYASHMGDFAAVSFRTGEAPNRRLRALYGEKDLTLWVDLAAIGSQPRLSEAYERLIANGWSLGRRNILIGNSDVDLENKILYIDDDEENDSTLLLWIYDAVLQAYQEQDAFRRQAILDKGLEVFSEKNNLTDLESMARVYEWAAWFWIDRTGNFSEVYPFMDDMILAFTGRAPRLLTEHRPLYNILSRAGTRDESTGFKRQFRDSSSQVRHATFSIQASLRYGRLAWVYLQERELLDDNAADFRLNNQCLDTAGRLLTSSTRLSNIGEILRTDLGDPSQTEPWDGPPGGLPDP